MGFTASIMQRAIQRKLRTRSSTGVATDSRLFLDMDVSRSSRVSMCEMRAWFMVHGLVLSEAQLCSVLDLVAEATRDRGAHAF